MNCLLLLREKQASAPPRQTLLSRRLKGEHKAVGTAEVTEEAAPLPSPAAPASVREPTTRPTPTQMEEVEPQREETASRRYCLAPRSGQHRIALPTHGEIVLGRFDPATNVAPDVDLSYDDRDNFAISRRHARIVGRDGRHEIEDMGSTNGTRVNGKRLEIGQQVRLRPGDRVGLGYCEFTYVSLPETNISLRAAPSQAHLWVTFTGQRFPLPTWGEVVVGRSDPTIGLISDIDLSAVEEAAHVVARRHVKIIARSGSHYIEDLGSANGTKLNGVRIRIGELRLLGSGDHLWLGGCVLAYDVERQPDEQGLG
ncbi:MAG: FHA domain-containing protein [Chloroflexota bacterium]|nr:FHA domain-containing protein [Chloroflexota bacterium]